MAKKQNPQILSPENYIRQRARSLPIFKCLVNEGWEEGGLSQVTIARSHINGNITYCSYLVDLHCLGVKDTFYDFNITEEQFDEMRDRMSQGYDLVEIDYVLAHNIIHAGWEFGEEIGFKPHKDFLSITQYMLEEDNDEIPLIEIACGDSDGKPIYVQSPFDDEASVRRIIAKLEKNVGRGNYRFVMQDDIWDDEDEGDEDDEDDEDWDDNDAFFLDDSEEDAEMIYFQEYAQNSYEENVRIFLDLSQYLDELDRIPEPDDDDDDDDEGVENLLRLNALADLLYQEFVTVSDLDKWLDRWSAESKLYAITDNAFHEMIGLTDKTSLTKKDIAFIRSETDSQKLDKYFKKKWGDLPYPTALKIQDMEESPSKTEKIAAALARFPNYGLIKLEDIMNRIIENRLNEEEIYYPSVFGDRREITSAEYARLQTMRLGYFLQSENLAGLESLYYDIEEEFEFDDNLDEHIGVLQSLLYASRIAMLRNVLLELDGQ